MTKYSNNVDPSTFTISGRSSGNNAILQRLHMTNIKNAAYHLFNSQNENITLRKKTKRYSEIMKGNNSHNLNQVARKNLLFSSSYNRNSKNLTKVNNSLILTNGDGSSCNKVDSILDINI